MHRIFQAGRLDVERPHVCSSATSQRFLAPWDGIGALSLFMEASRHPRCSRWRQGFGCPEPRQTLLQPYPRRAGTASEEQEEPTR